MDKIDSKDKKIESSVDEDKRDFLFVTTAGLAIAGGGVTLWSLIDTMNPSKDVLALASTEVDLSPIEEGQSLTVMWRGKPIFIRHRTNEEIDDAGDTDITNLQSLISTSNGVVSIGANSLKLEETSGSQKMWATNSSGEIAPIDITNGTKLLINGRDVE